MPRFEGSLARTLDFGKVTTTGVQPGRAGLRLAVSPGVLRGPHKYKVLEQRRREAQRKARRLLELLEAE